MTSEQQPVAYQAKLWVEEDDLIIPQQRAQYQLTKKSAKEAAAKYRNNKKKTLREACEKNPTMQELKDKIQKDSKCLKELESQALADDPEYLPLKIEKDKSKQREKEEGTKLEHLEEQSKMKAAHIIRAIAT